MPEALKGLPFEPPRGSGNAATINPAAVRDFAEDAARYVRSACGELGVTPQRIAIDAPSSPCEDGVARRAAELAMDDRGISCFATPSRGAWREIRSKVEKHLREGGAENRLPHANQLWMLVGFELFSALREVAPCMEVYPQATAQVLGASGVHKSSTLGVEQQLEAVANYTGWPADDQEESEFSEIGWGPAHDRLDAYLAAWVAALPEGDRVALGDPPDDVIWVPRVRRSEGLRRVPRREPKPPATSPARSNDGQRATGYERACPACESFQFRRWPWGWDAHAAHRCKGIPGSDPDRRKAIFRSRFGRLLEEKAT